MLTAKNSTKINKKLKPPKTKNNIPNLPHQPKNRCKMCTFNKISIHPNSSRLNPNRNLETPNFPLPQCLQFHTKLHCFSALGSRKTDQFRKSFSFQNTGAGRSFLWHSPNCLFWWTFWIAGFLGFEQAFELGFLEGVWMWFLVPWIEVLGGIWLFLIGNLGTFGIKFN
jgi:hypothetical protein